MQRRQPCKCVSGKVGVRRARHSSAASGAGYSLTRRGWIAARATWRASATPSRPLLPILCLFAPSCGQPVLLRPATSADPTPSQMAVGQLASAYASSSAASRFISAPSALSAVRLVRVRRSDPRPSAQSAGGSFSWPIRFEPRPTADGADGADTKPGRRLAGVSWSEPQCAGKGRSRHQRKARRGQSEGAEKPIPEVLMEWRYFRLWSASLRPLRPPRFIGSRTSICSSWPVRAT